MRLSFYVVDVNYVIKDGKAVIQLFGRTDDGRQACLVDDRFEPYFYVKGTVEDETLLSLKKDVFRVSRVQRCVRRINEKDAGVIKVFTNLPKAVPMIKDLALNLGLECFEYD